MTEYVVINENDFAILLKSKKKIHQLINGFGCFGFHFMVKNKITGNVVFSDMYIEDCLPVMDSIKSMYAGDN